VPYEAGLGAAFGEQHGMVQSSGKQKHQTHHIGSLW